MTSLVYYKQFHKSGVVKSTQPVLPVVRTLHIEPLLDRND
jgi:hypothetical protein